MATKVKEAEPAVRKSVLMFGGIAIAVVLTAFVLMNFVMGGSTGSPDSPPSGAVSQPAGEGFQPSPATVDSPDGVEHGVLHPGGRNPFTP